MTTTYTALQERLSQMDCAGRIGADDLLALRSIATRIMPLEQLYNAMEDEAGGNVLAFRGTANAQHMARAARLFGGMA